jgi:hypothetical protein
MVAEIVAEMDYLRQREQKLRDTNESTNNRVKWFAFGTMGMLVSLGAWQVIYLRAYFRYVLALGMLRFWERSTDIWLDRSILSRSRDNDWDDRWFGWRGLLTDETLVLLVSRRNMYNGMRRNKSSYRMWAPGKDIDIKVISFRISQCSLIQSPPSLLSSLDSPWGSEKVQRVWASSLKRPYYM